MRRQTAFFTYLNSDFDRSHTSGSILIVDPMRMNGEQKLKAITTARMGRSLHINDSLMLRTLSIKKSWAVRGKYNFGQVSEDGLGIASGGKLAYRLFTS
jgi:hypothetical protein